MVRESGDEVLLWKLRTAVAAVLAAGEWEIENWPHYVRALRCGVNHLADAIPPRSYAALRLDQYPEEIWGEISLVAAIPVSLYNGVLPHPQKLGLSAFVDANPSIRASGWRKAFELLMYWWHDLACGRDLEASMWEIVCEDRFSSRPVRTSMCALCDASRENRLSHDLLLEMGASHDALTTKMLNSAYLCLSQRSSASLVREVIDTGMNGCELSIARAMQAVMCCNEIVANAHSMDSDYEAAFHLIEEQWSSDVREDVL